MSKRILLIAAFALLAYGCAGKKNLIKPTETEQIKEQVQPETTIKDEAPIRFTDWANTQEIKTIHFDFDKSDLRQEDREILKNNAEFLKSNPDILVLVEGHTDERGTVEYNLALAQKRAAAVREYYGQLGVSLVRIGTISYGKEKPVDPNHTEEAWAKNRRAETKVRNK